MRAYRIIEEKRGDRTYYKIQEKMWFLIPYLWWWSTFTEHDEMGESDMTFSTIEKAEDYLRCINPTSKVVKQIEFE